MSRRDYIPKAYLVNKRPLCGPCTSAKVRVWQTAGVLRSVNCEPLSLDEVIEYDAEVCASEGVDCSVCKARIYRSY